MFARLSLRRLSILWVSLALAVGILSSGLWFASTRSWQEHLNTAYSNGIEVYYALESNTSMSGVDIVPLDTKNQMLAESGRFDQISGAPVPAYVTVLSLSDGNDGPRNTTGLKIAVVSDRLQYRVAEIAAGIHNSPSLKFGELTRLLATYCSNPILYARFSDQTWQRIDGLEYWGCDTAPNDYRILAFLLAALTLAVLVTQIANTSEAFEHFSRELHMRRLKGGPDSYDTNGPQELADIVKSVNSYLEEERSQLSKRAIVLSGVSHDLGTPATRLRLRSALIEDTPVREKFEADIDQMTGIIESVLTYTRSELSSEAPKKLSLMSLVEAVVADYQDTNHPVVLQTPEPLSTKADRSVFAPRSGIVAMTDATKLLIYARPIALRRAITNLIDNALKYGRRAHVSLTADSDWAIVTVEDEGGEKSALDMANLLDPFERGENTQSIAGFGLGLTIVATVARQHGGRIEFEDGKAGVMAKLWLQRT